MSALVGMNARFQPYLAACIEKSRENVLSWEQDPDRGLDATLSRLRRSARPHRRGVGRRRRCRREAAPADEDRGADRGLRRRSGARGPRLGAGGPARARRAADRAVATPPGPRCSTAPTATPDEDARAAAIGRAAGALVNIVDNLEDSDFITPAIVDRDPVTVAIGTEGAAPVLARKIKAEIEAMLPATLGLLTRIGQAFRARVEALDSQGAARVLDPLLLRARPARARGGRGGGAGRARAAARRGRRAAARLRAPGRHRPGRSGAADAEGAAAAARGRRGDPRPAGAAGDPRARAARGDDHRGRQDGLRAVLEAGRHQRADGAARRGPARRSCG